MSGLAGRQRLALSLALSCGAVASGCSFCADEDVRRVVSPDRRYIVQTSVRSCGAATDYRTRVEITQTRCLFGCSFSPYDASGYRTALASWEAAGRLVVECQGCAARPERRWGEVVVRFREPPPLSEADETQSREGGDHAGQATHD